MQAFNLSKNERKVIFLSSLGGALELYDFIIYVIFAPIIGQAFFPKTDKLATLMSVYAIFAIGYLVRPLGGIVFSHFGDTHGRKKTFALSVMIMAVSTFVIGLLPTYEHIGIYATIMLIVLRIFQGLSIGGEIPGALTFMCEHVQQGRRGFACGILLSGLNFGIFLGSLISLILTSLLSNSQIATFGWRIPFIVGGFLGVISFYIRKQMTESPMFLSYKNNAAAARIPLVEAMTLHWGKILQGIGLTVFGAVIINLLFIFMPTYLFTMLSYPKQQASALNAMNLVLYSILIMFFCSYSDKIGRTRMLFISSFAFACLGYFLFAGLSQGTISLLCSLFGIAVLSGGVAIYPCVLVELFPISIRYTGTAISYNVAYALGGLSPLIATFLIKNSGSVVAPGFYLVFCAFLCVIACVSIKRNKSVEEKLMRTTEK